MEVKEISQAALKRFVKLATSGQLAYNEANKDQFHRQGVRVLRAIANKLGLVKGTYDIHWNPGGIAVSGDITLHAEHLYIDFSESCLGDIFMYRWCKHQKDYTGGPNQWMKWERLLEFGTPDIFRRCMNGGGA